MRPDVARKQFDEEAAAAGATAGTSTTSTTTDPNGGGGGTAATTETDEDGGSTNTGPAKPKRFHGSVEFDSTRVGHDASRIADEVLSHLSGLVGANVRVTLEVEAESPDGAPEIVVRTVTENSRTLKFSTHGFEGG